MCGRPSARALSLADGVWGHRSSAGPEGREQRTGPQRSGSRARERSRRPTGAGGIGAAQRAKGASSGRAPKKRRPSPRALTPADGVWGHRSSAAPEGREQRTGPQEAEAEPESAHAGRRGLGASEQRSARRARAADGPPKKRRPSPRALTLADGVWGHRSSAAPEGREQRTGPQEAEAERESAHAGRRGLGASEQRSARRARAADG